MFNLEEATATLRAFEKPEAQINDIERTMTYVSDHMESVFAKAKQVAKEQLPEKERRSLIYNLNKTLDHFTEMRRSLSNASLALEALLVECESVIEAEQN